MNELIVILGPTASGKTGLSIKIAKKYHGQIVSADSRQVYRGLDIGAGKITKSQMQGIPHYLLDIADPKKRFSVAEYQKLALAAIKKIQKENNVPILVGGTGFYLQSIIDGIIIPEVKPDWKLRAKLEKKSTTQLYSMLSKKDSMRAKTIDKHNKRRLVRALEIIAVTKKPIIPLKKKGDFEVLEIGVKKSPDALKKLIKRRLLARLKNKALIKEVKKLRKSLSWKRLEELGLEYRFVAQYLQKEISYPQMVNTLQKEIEHYAKRQMTWFKRDARIHWVENYAQARKLIDKFI